MVKKFLTWRAEINFLRKNISLKNIFGLLPFIGVAENKRCEMQFFD